MADRISFLPEGVLCHILSFLPTKQAVVTSILSKIWKSLWRSVPTLDFNDLRDERYIDRHYSRFVEYVNAVILSRDMHQPIQKFRLCCDSSHCGPTNIITWVNAAIQRRVEHIDLYLHHNLYVHHNFMNLPSSILSHRTLVVLKLRGSIQLRALSIVDFPSLKVLHLNNVTAIDRYLAKLVSGCPVLEDLEAKDLIFLKSPTVGKFKRLPNLVRADIAKPHIPLKAVSNVEFLRIDRMDVVVSDRMMDMVNNDEDAEPCVRGFIPMFNNLIHIELRYYCYTKYWLEVVEVLKHCPKLQCLVIDQDRVLYHEYDEGGDWPYPQSVPECISLHLKSCCLIGFKGSEGEFRFARFIMQNARLLRTMTICFSIAASLKMKRKMKNKLSLCTRHSATCELSIKW